MFGTTGGFGTGSSLFGSTPQAATSSPAVKDYEVPAPPDDTVQALRFSPASLQQNYLAAGSWDGLVRLWETSLPKADLNMTPGQTPAMQAVPKAQQSAGGPVLDLCYSDVSLYSGSSLELVLLFSHSHGGIVTFLFWQDGSKIFFGSADKTLRMWDLGSNQVTQIGAHDNCIKSVHFIQSPSYQCVMTGSWDKTLKV